MVKQLALNTEFSVLDLEMSPIKDLSSFNRNTESAVFIDFMRETISEADAREICTSLPDNYKAIFLRKNIGAIETGLQESLNQYLSRQRSTALLTELYSAINLFSDITGDAQPLVSLRVVTAEYVEKEYPSVSKYYHRDAAALTLTKCFYGEGAIYLREDNIRRDYFRLNSIALSDSDAAYDYEDFRVVPPTKWILLKGEMYQGIDSRNQAVVDIVLGQGAVFKDYAKGMGLVHKGGCVFRSS